MAPLFKLSCLVLALAVLVSVPMVADAAVTCGQVSSSLSPCIPYLTRGGPAPPPACCSGVRSLNAAAATTADRQAACRCIQQVARGMSGLKPNLASGLPGKCGVSIPYPIGLTTNCNSIK